MNALVTTGPAELRAMLDAIGYPRDPDQPEDAETDGTGLSGLGGPSLGGPSLGGLGRLAGLEPPQERLATQLGLTGAVALGDHLDRPRQLARQTQSEAEAARHGLMLEALWNRRTALRTRVERRYAQAFEGTQPLPDGGKMLAVLTEHDALTDRSAETLVLCAQKLGTRYRQLLGSTLSVVRRELHWLREDLLKGLQGLSEEATALVALDNVMNTALRASAADAHRSLEAGLGQRFAERLMEAVLLLPADQAPRSLDAWFKRRGWVAQHLHECRRVTLAIADLEWSSLRALLDSCAGPVQQAASSEDASATNPTGASVAPLPQAEVP